MMAKFRVTAELEYEYVLVLNPMMSNTENFVEFKYKTPEEAKRFYDGEKVEPYKEDGSNLFDGGTKQYHKSFRKGSPFEWLNPLMEHEWTTPGTHGHGLHEVIIGIENVVRLEQIY